MFFYVLESWTLLGDLYSLIIVFNLSQKCIPERPNGQKTYVSMKANVPVIYNLAIINIRDN